MSTPRTKAPPVLPREVTKTPEDVIIIDSGTGDVADGEGGTLILILKDSSAFYLCCIYSSALQTRFYHGSKCYGP